MGLFVVPRTHTGLMQIIVDWISLDCVGAVVAVIVWQVNLQLPMQSVPITTDVVEFEFLSGRGVQHYLIKFVSDLRQVSGFPRVLRFPPPIKLAATI